MPARLLVLIAVLGGCGASYVEPPRWARTEWISLRGVQCELATGDAQGALYEVDDLEMTYVSGAAPLGPEERMWLLVYRGIALDLLGRRDDAVAAYREAARLHEHEVTTQGIEHALEGLPHLREMRAGCEEG